MATIIYKKFFKKTPTQPELCQHQRNTSHASDVPLTSLQTTVGPRDEADTKDGKASSYAVGTCETCQQEKNTMKRYRWRLIGGLFLPFLVQSLDTTIIAGAVPYIASDFHQLSQINWIVSAYNLTAATFIPFWGQYADVFGRYAAIQTALITMLIGSTLCSAAPVTAFPMLVVGRAFQGIGCAGLLIITKVVLADKVSLKENAKNNTIFTIVAGVGYGIGPVIGGYLTQTSWRWCFIINIPIGVLGLVIAHVMLRPVLLGPQQITRTDGVVDENISQSFTARISTIDFGGQVFFLFGMGLLVLSLTWAGSSYEWSDVKVLAPLVIGVILVILFIIWEYLMLPGSALARRNPTRKAMLPLNLICTRNAGILIYINFVTGIAMYAVFYFVGLYFALIADFSSGKSGRNLIYYMPGLAGGAYLAMYTCNVRPRQTFLPLFLGTLIEPLGLTLLAIALSHDSLPFIYGMLALTGVGTGLRFMPGTLHAVGYFPTQIASVVSSMSLGVSLGGTIATTLMLNIFNNVLRTSGFGFSATSAESFDAIAGLGNAERVLFKEKARRGIVLAFFAVTAFCWLGLVVMGGLGNVWIGKGGEGGGEGEKDRVCRGSYLGSLISRRGERENKGDEVEGSG